MEASTTGALRDKYAVVGVGETAYLRGAGRTTRSMAHEAVAKAMADAGLGPGEVDGMMSYQMADAVTSPFVAGDLGLRLNFYMDVVGGGASIEALIGLAIGAIEGGMCKTVAIFRSMNGYSGVRMGGTGAHAAAPVTDEHLHMRVYGHRSPAQWFSPTFMRHMYEYGTTPGQVASVKVFHSHHASNNPKALYRKRVTVDEVLASRYITKPLHLLDCCTESDNATAIIVTSAARAR
ncbi:MAG TPA: hypothetical protein VI199_06655, partial [Novosphingobium sp.]